LWDRALKEPGVIVDQVGYAVFIKGSVDLLDDGPLNEVAGLKGSNVIGV
jgi:hypothetical protein